MNKNTLLQKFIAKHPKLIILCTLMANDGLIIAAITQKYKINYNMPFYKILNDGSVHSYLPNGNELSFLFGGNTESSTNKQNSGRYLSVEMG